ncbi:MAG: M15 family metallopeptidase [Lachnospiraceae bacterium]|nr:M15 family metallopeptidase [Lachnospiraceae bacterium]
MLGAGTSDTETTDLFDADSLGTNSDGAEESDKERSISDAADSFYYTALTDEIKARITGKSYPDTDEPLQISYEDLAYVHVLHYDFQAQIQEGELICNQSVAQDLVEIFYELYENQYPIEKIRLIDEYDADDEVSMADNNTSCFNYRTVPGRTTLSNHSYGCAIDINPLYNPYVRTSGGKEQISPDNAVPYADRSADFPYKIDKNDLCYRVFIEHGFSWGGAWNSSKDYQHFEKVE